MILRFQVSELANCAKARGPGFAEAVMSVARIDGEYLEIDSGLWHALTRKHGPGKAARRGLGDLVESAAKPIARAIDRVAGTDLEHCPGCAKRREWLNRIAHL